jgi:hypothetical protein
MGLLHEHVVRDHLAMAGPTIAARVLDELRRARRPLDDDELARRLGVSPRQTINQVCRGLERSGRLRRYAGSEGKIVNDAGRAVPASDPLTAPLIAAPGQDVHRQAGASGAPPGRGAAWPGQPITATDLAKAGFQPLELRVTSLDVDLPSGRGCEWTTIGEVPAAPGLYAFTVEDAHQIRVAYVGLTEHLWMVTKGRLPGGGARGGQRYGRPRHAGLTRQRVNILIAGQLRAGSYDTGFASFRRRRCVLKKSGSSPTGTCAAPAGIAADRIRPPGMHPVAPRPAMA